VGVAPMAADLSGGRVEIARARLADAVALRAGSGPPPHFAGLVTGRAGGAGRAVPERVGPAHLLALLAHAAGAAARQAAAARRPARAAPASAAPASAAPRAASRRATASRTRAP